MHDIDISKLRVELARAGWSQQLLAGMLGTPPTTLSGWLRRVHPAPADLAQKIASALDLPVTRIVTARREP